MREEWLDDDEVQTIEPGDTRGTAAARLAVLGGRIARERFGQVEASWKADGSMLTRADLEIQAALERDLAAAFPEDAVLGEEGLRSGPPDAAYRWVLDPIDGTNNFGRGLPGFSVSVGVLCDGRPVAGAVYDPLADWLFRAAEGQGRWAPSRSPTTTAPRSGTSRGRCRCCSRRAARSRARTAARCSRSPLPKRRARPSRSWPATRPPTARRWTISAAERRPGRRPSLAHRHPATYNYRPVMVPRR